MNFKPELIKDLISQSKVFNFDEIANQVFDYQFEHNDVYHDYVTTLRKLHHSEERFFLPVELFKKHVVATQKNHFETIYTSSSTTGTGVSRHHVVDNNLYEQSYTSAFRLFYGPTQDTIILALLPSYLERTGSSLVAMCNGLIGLSNHAASGFYLDDFEKLYTHLIQALQEKNKKVILLGVTFALLDFAIKYPGDYGSLIVMETGGMKGRREEMTREEVHGILKEKMKVSNIHSEYGMTELLSQAYAQQAGFFKCPPWMRVEIVDVNDPFKLMTEGRTGRIRITDLANVYSCSFILTSDLGRMLSNGCFEVLGRMDYSDVRGCSLMYG
jgi:phenylacetate-coenzyme A ligase PaaK-like adenylate-forming protein